MIISMVLTVYTGEVDSEECWDWHTRRSSAKNGQVDWVGRIEEENVLRT